MSWVEITVHQTPHPTLRPGRLTLEVADSHPIEGFVRCLRQLPWEDRGWDVEAKRWWVAKRQQETVCQAACAFYGEVYLIEGPRTLNVKTGQIVEQGTLFEEE